MNNHQDYTKPLLYLLKCAVLNQKPETVFENIDYRELFQLARKHGVENILYYSVKALDIPSDVLDLYKRSLYVAAAADSKQQYYMALLSAQFQAHNIKFMPLKGQILKKLYPSPDMRKSGDIDILFENKDSEKVKNIMLENGFKVKEYGEHNIHDEYSANGVLIEMHRSLISEKYFEWGELCSDIEKSWIQENNCEYKLSDEDYYLYMIAHMAKHMKYGGIGVRFILDVFVYLSKYNNSLNWEYISRKLEHGKLLKFEQVCKKLSGVWFENAEHDTVTKELEEYIISGQLFGLQSRYVTSDYIIHHGAQKMSLYQKIKRLFSATFMPFDEMKGKYPILKKYAVLLPFCWIHRIFYAVFFKKGRVKEIANYYDNIDLSEVEMMDRFKKNIGL